MIQHLPIIQIQSKKFQNNQEDKKIMKKILTTFLCIICFFTISLTAYAQVPEPSAQIQQNIEYLENGDYVITTLEEENTLSFARSTATKSGKRTTKYYNNSNQLLWTFTLSGTFSYNQKTATCTKTSCSFSSTTSTWTAASKSATKSGATATGKITAKHTVDGKSSTTSRTITLSCKPNGTLY